jgi:hypothetical protein
MLIKFGIEKYIEQFTGNFDFNPYLSPVTFTVHTAESILLQMAGRKNM